MNVQPLAVERAAALAMLREYKAHRNAYDQRDWEIERIYRAIARGKTVISVNDAIVRGGLDSQGRPRLAIMRADQHQCICQTYRSDRVVFCSATGSKAAEWYFQIPWPNRTQRPMQGSVALLPRIPPQHRPAQGTLPSYHLLWEANWSDLPDDPYLLRRIGKDAFVVVAAWELTEIELSVVRAHANT